MMQVRQRLFCKRLLRILLALAVGAGSIEGARGQNAAVSKELSQLWQSRLDGIYTIQVAGRRFSGGASSLDNLSPAELNRLMDGYDPDSDGSLVSLVRALRRDKVSGGPYWAEVKYSTDRSRRSERRGSQTHRVVDDRADAYSTPQHNQVQLHLVGQSNRYMMDLAAVAFEFSGTAQRAFDVEEYDDGIAVLSYGDAGNKLTVTVDRASGMVLKSVATRNGDIVSVMYQRGSIDAGEGVVLPNLKLDASFRDGRLSRASFFSPTSVIVNQSIPESEFHVAANSGTKVFDRRSGTRKFVRLQSDAEDVVSAVEAQASLARSSLLARTEEPISTGRLSMILVNAAIVFVLFLAVVFRRRARWGAS